MHAEFMFGGIYIKDSALLLCAFALRDSLNRWVSICFHGAWKPGSGEELPGTLPLELPPHFDLQPGEAGRI